MASAYRPDELEALERMARVLLGQGRHGAARRLLEGLVAVAPGLVRLHLQLGELHLLAGDPDRAAGSAAAALELAPDDPEAVGLASLTQAAIGAREQALRLASRLGHRPGGTAGTWERRARLLAAGAGAAPTRRR